MRLGNKVAIITGGGSGIGRASAYLFAKEGARVVVAQRTRVTGEETVTNIKSNGGEAIFVRTDVTMASEVACLIRETVNTFGKIDVLFSNAGAEQKPTPVENMDESLWESVYAVNVKGVFLVTKYVVPEMKKAGGGVIINTASLLGVRARRPHLSAYSSAKGAVIMLTRALAVELAPDKIRVNCLYPTLVDTPLARRLAAEEAKDTGWEKYWESYSRNVPLGRMATPKDVACTALYLASDESSMLTGTCISVDGGLGI